MNVFDLQNYGNKISLYAIILLDNCWPVHLVNVLLGIIGFVNVTHYSSLTEFTESSRLFTISKHLVFIGVLSSILIGLRGSNYRTWKKHSSRLYVRIVFSIFVVLSQVWVTLFAWESSEEIQMCVSRGMEKSMPNYLVDHQSRQNWDYLQRKWECCGIKSHQDWIPMSPTISDPLIPLSCRPNGVSGVEPEEIPVSCIPSSFSSDSNSNLLCLNADHSLKYAFGCAEGVVQTLSFLQKLLQILSWTALLVQFLVLIWCVLLTIGVLVVKVIFLGFIELIAQCFRRSFVKKHHEKES